MFTIPMTIAAALPATGAMLTIGPVAVLALVALAAAAAALLSGTITEVRRPGSDTPSLTHCMPGFRHAA